MKKNHLGKKYAVLSSSLHSSVVSGQATIIDNDIQTN